MYRWSFKGNSPINFESMDTPAALAWVLARDQVSGLLPKIATEQLNQYFEAAQNYLDGLKQNGLVDWANHVSSLPNGKYLVPATVDNGIWWNLSGLPTICYTVVISKKYFSSNLADDTPPVCECRFTGL